MLCLSADMFPVSGVITIMLGIPGDVWRARAPRRAPRTDTRPCPGHWGTQYSWHPRHVSHFSTQTDECQQGTGLRLEAVCSVYLVMTAGRLLQLVTTAAPRLQRDCRGRGWWDTRAAPGPGHRARELWSEPRNENPSCRQRPDKVHWETRVAESAVITFWHTLTFNAPQFLWQWWEYICSRTTDICWLLPEVQNQGGCDRRERFSRNH